MGRFLQWLRLPGLIAPFTYYDSTTDQTISLRTSSRYTVLTVNGTELYFLRESGRFDGAGTLALDNDPLFHVYRASAIRRANHRDDPV